MIDLPITRRGFIQAGGALFVSLQTSAAPGNRMPVSAWLEIRSDSTILVRTGRTETGTGMSGFYPQTVAEELYVLPETITLIMGDTDRTPDGGYSAGFLIGAKNLRKVSAYAYQALLKLAAAHLGVPVSNLTVKDGIVSGGGKTVSYGQLVQGQQLDLQIPITGEPTRMDRASGWGVAGLNGYVVEGEPPIKPISQYQIVGKSFPMPVIPDKVTGKTQWICDITLPGMLHARMIRPATLGATLISTGTIDKKRFPTAEIVRKGNLVAVVSPNEWEAISASQSVAANTKWTPWAGLPGSENLTQTLREYRWTKPDEFGKAADVTAPFASAAKVISATYEQPYVRHAPIGPFVAVADVRKNDITTVWSHSAHPQGLRAQIANLLGTTLEKVVIRWADQSGQYGRTTHAADGAEADAVILSQLTGKPVRVQWTLQEDLTWSSVSPGWFSDIKGSLDTNGQLTAIQSAFHSPHMFDARLLGAILAGMPCSTSIAGGWVATIWPYDRIPHRFEQSYGRPNLAADSPNGGLRGNIMRTPGQRQQNFALEGLMNETAAALSIDPIEFRLRHTTDQRLIDILTATAKEAGWKPRPSPGKEKTGRGVCVMVRDNAYWAGIAEVTVTPSTGVVQVTKFTIGADCGKIINPRQLDRCMKGGLIMGLSEALKEEVTFDREKITSTDWSRYKILTMAEVPEIKVVQISRDDKGFGVGGEAANALATPAVVAAFFDATGVQPRRIPLTPTYVKSLLKT